MQKRDQGLMHITSPQRVVQLVGFVSKTQLKLLILDSMALGASPARPKLRDVGAVEARLYTTQAARR
jgi:hypothetical protein